MFQPLPKSSFRWSLDGTRAKSRPDQGELIGLATETLSNDWFPARVSVRSGTGAI